MDWFEPIRAYCERTDGAFWAEPINAVSNAAFLAAAGFAVWRERTGPRGDPVCLGLAGLVAVVGVGSFLFHTVASRWSMLADVIPIALFIHAYFALAMYRFLGLGLRASGAVTLAFAAFAAGSTTMLEAATGLSLATLTNGSIDYLPALLALFGVSAALLGSTVGGLPDPRREAGLRMAWIALLFLVSLGFRTLDRTICADWPSGTHFLWHLLNAGVLFGLVETARLHRQRSAGAA